MKTRPSAFSACQLIGITLISFSAFVTAQDDAKKAPGKEAPAPAPAAPELSPEKIKALSSYALGLRAGGDFASQFGQFGVTLSDLEMESFIKGFSLAFEEKELTESEDALRAAMEALGNQVQKREKEIADANKVSGQKFLEENGKRKGVITTDSGLQYEIINKGGDKAYVMPKDAEAPQKIFLVNYKGTLTDGTQFDASPAGEPVPMTLQVVPGFREALTTMPVGAKWKLYLSPDLAYGERRASSKIAPNSTLIFELELTAIEDAPQQQGLPFQIPGQ